MNSSPLIIAADGLPLKQSLRKAERGRRFKALMFVLPLFAFVSVSFVMPIFDMLFRSVDNPVVATHLPKTIKKLNEWDGKSLPNEMIFATLAQELLAAKKNRTVGKVAARLNFETSGMRSTLNKTVRKLKRYKGDVYTEAFIKFDKRWANKNTWHTIKRIGKRYTGVQYLAALDLKVGSDGKYHTSTGRSADIRANICAHVLDKFVGYNYMSYSRVPSLLFVSDTSFTY